MMPFSRRQMLPCQLIVSKWREGWPFFPAVGERKYHHEICASKCERTGVLPSQMCVNSILQDLLFGSAQHLQSFL